MLLCNVQDLIYRKETGFPAQFCPFAEEADAIEYAVWYSQGLINGTVEIGRSAEDKRIIIVSGPVRTICLIPAKGSLKGYYEVVVGENKIKENVVSFDANSLDCGVEQCFARKAVELLYNHDGEYMYKGKLLPVDNMRRLCSTYIYEDGTVWDSIRCRERAQTNVKKNKDSGYKRKCIALKIGDNTVQKLHHVIYCAYNLLSLDMIKVLTNNISDYAEWYYNCDNADIVAARTIRYADKHAKWGIDHIDNDTQNNRVDNLQLCTVSANTTLRTLRNSGFEMIDY